MISCGRTCICLLPGATSPLHFRRVSSEAAGWATKATPRRSATSSRPQRCGHVTWTQLPKVSLSSRFIYIHDHASDFMVFQCWNPSPETLVFDFAFIDFQPNFAFSVLILQKFTNLDMNYGGQITYIPLSFWSSCFLKTAPHPDSEPLVSRDCGLQFRSFGDHLRSCRTILFDFEQLQCNYN